MEYFPVDPRARMTLGLRSLDLDDWFQADGRRTVELARKRRLLASEFSEVCAQLPEGRSGAAELAELGIAAVRAKWPEFEIPAADEEYPLVQLALVVQEDLVVMTRTDAGWILSAAVLCAPSRWRLREKLGKSLSGIHAPVPGYEDQIGAPVETMFDKLLVERPMWRANWTLLDTDELYLPDSAEPHELGADFDVATQVFFRVERQTIRKMPASGDIAFTIRTYIQSLGDLIAEHPDAASDLAAAMRNSTEPMVAYKGWQQLRPAVLRWLDVASGGGTGVHSA